MDVREISARLTITGRPSGNSAGATESELTIILPTHNRVDLCKAQVRFLQRWGIHHRVIVADSSDVPDDGLREACTGLIEYRRFDPETLPDIKLAVVARSVSTPYVAMMTDDDISFPHTIDACLDYLRRNPDTVVAQGYVLGFSAIERSIDIHSMQWFIGTIAEPTPLRRLYELMRRYQPFFWAAFRTDVYVRAMEAANAVKGTFFQELAFTATVSLLGNAARLPMIQTLRGDEESHTPAAESHPFFWFLKDARLFFNTYARYRDALVDLLHELDTGRPPKKGALFRLARLLGGDAPVESGPESAGHVIDIIHATYFGREVDTGKINHVARMLLGDPVGPLPLPKPAERNLAIGPGDLMHPSSIPERRYVWRDAVVNAEPRSEITITPEEIARVEAALDIYLPPIASVARCSRNRSSHGKPNNGQKRRMFHCRGTTETSGSLKPPATAIIGCWEELTAAPLAKRSRFPSSPSQSAVRRSRSSFMMAVSGNMCLVPLISRVVRDRRGMVRSRNPTSALRKTVISICPSAWC